jgi:hypothetical protein
MIVPGNTPFNMLSHSGNDTYEVSLLLGKVGLELGTNLAYKENSIAYHLFTFYMDFNGVEFESGTYDSSDITEDDIRKGVIPRIEYFIEDNRLVSPSVLDFKVSLSLVYTSSYAHHNADDMQKDTFNTVLKFQKDCPFSFTFDVTVTNDKEKAKNGRLLFMRNTVSMTFKGVKQNEDTQIMRYVRDLMAKLGTTLKEGTFSVEKMEFEY